MRAGLDGLEAGRHDLILLPEYATAPGLVDGASIHQFAASQGADFLRAVGEAARRMGCLIALSGPVRSGRRWFNRSLVFDASGEIASSYDKLHLTAV